MGREFELPAIANRTEQDSYGFESTSLGGLLNLWNIELEDKPGDCCCPVLEDGTRGFRRRCEVHGKRTRKDFERLTALRAEIFSRVRAPESARRWGRNPS